MLLHPTDSGNEPSTRLSEPPSGHDDGAGHRTCPVVDVVPQALSAGLVMLPSMMTLGDIVAEAATFLM